VGRLNASRQAQLAHKLARPAIMRLAPGGAHRGEILTIRR
jgi:hypothetical protein